METWKHWGGNPTPAQLQQHKARLDTLIAFGELLNLTTSSPVFPDKKIAEIVKATLIMLKDDLSLWHGNEITGAEAEVLLQQVFPE